MSTIIYVGNRHERSSMWDRFRKDCIYKHQDPSTFTDGMFVNRRDKALAECGAKWVNSEDSVFRLEFENEVDANWFILRWT